MCCQDTLGVVRVCVGVGGKGKQGLVCVVTRVLLRLPRGKLKISFLDFFSMLTFYPPRRSFATFPASSSSLFVEKTF